MGPNHSLKFEEKSERSREILGRFDLEWPHRVGVLVLMKKYANACVCLILTKTYTKYTQNTHICMAVAKLTSNTCATVYRSMSNIMSSQLIFELIFELILFVP